MPPTATSRTSRTCPGISSRIRRQRRMDGEVGIRGVQVRGRRPRERTKPMTIQFQARHQAEVFESMAATSPEVSVADFAARDLAGLLKALADRADEAALATV